MVGPPSGAFASAVFSILPMRCIAPRAPSARKIVSNNTKKFFPKPLQNPPVARPNGDALSLKRPAPPLLPLHAPCRFLRAVTIHRETIHVQAYCTCFGRSLQRARTYRRRDCAGQCRRQENAEERT